MASRAPRDEGRCCRCRPFDVFLVALRFRIARLAFVGAVFVPSGTAEWLARLDLGSCGPHTEYKTLRIPKIHPEIHFRTENTDQNTKKYENHPFSYFFRILVCIFGSEVYFGVYFRDSKGFVFCMGTA